MNIGTGEEVSIGEVAELVKEVVGFEGELVFDAGKPDGTPEEVDGCWEVAWVGVGSMRLS